MEQKGQCLDGVNERYSYFDSYPLPADTSDTYCLLWCGAILHPSLVGVEVERWTDYVLCVCRYARQDFDDISRSDFNPEARFYDDGDGDGPVVSTTNNNAITCYVNTVSCRILFYYMISVF